MIIIKHFFFLSLADAELYLNYHFNERDFYFRNLPPDFLLIFFRPPKSELSVETNTQLFLI